VNLATYWWGELGSDVKGKMRFVGFLGLAKIDGLIGLGRKGVW
jgi:hypothetical protein